MVASMDRQQLSSKPLGGGAAAAALWREGAFAALWRGWHSRVLAVAPNFALTIALWEQCRSAIRALGA